MKFDDHGMPSQQNRVSPKSAMDDYFADMFGSAEDPLKKLSASQERQVITAKESNKDRESVTLAAFTSPSISSEVSKDIEQVLPRSTALVKKHVSEVKSSLPVFDEPEPIVGKISPLIIPAAFPKLAPPEQKVSIASPKTQTKQKSQLDAKTALAILEKKRSSLSAEQIKRLEEKLKQHAVSTQIQPATKQDASIPKQLSEPSISIKESVKPECKTEPDKKPVAVKAELKEELGIQTPEKNDGAPIVPSFERPAWSNSRFECLLFSVAGLKLAVPLISLGAIYKIEKEYTPLVGRAEWFMGLYQYLDRNVRVIDTAQWVMPERCSPEVRNAYKFIIRLGGSDWGMACDAVHESIQLYPDQVKWRSERTKRAWLFGTVIDHMCALVDADALGNMLDQQSTKHSRIFSNKP